MLRVAIVKTSIKPTAERRYVWVPEDVKVGNVVCFETNVGLTGCLDLGIVCEIHQRADDNIGKLCDKIFVMTHEIMDSVCWWPVTMCAVIDREQLLKGVAW